ncbi:MAG: hypothetical protein CME62_13340 [Halobacteriovoraceae bacterium]|nr:hypothetical protein [Halobacteriovoraceae bacterium]|tara:strand:+ start:14059 stop:15696 length:1638 start_codon:yes stop_codon:yes gene_type:complete
MKTILHFSLLFIFVSCLKGKPELLEENLEIAHTSAGEGAVHFMMDDFGALAKHGMESNILPFKVSVAALLLHRGFDPENNDPQDAIDKLFQEYGLPTKVSIQNLPEQQQIQMPEYFGLFKGNLHGGKYPFKVRIEGSGFSCAACHSGINYTEQGHPLPDQVFLGAPNTSLNLEAYTYDVYRAFLNIVNKKKEFKAYLLKIFPRITRMEYRTISLIFKKEFINKVKHLESQLNRQSPAQNGGAGLTNGVASLKFQLGILTNNETAPSETGYTSIPVIFDREFRNSLLYDGVYKPVKPSQSEDDKLNALAEVISFFTVSTTANHPLQAKAHIPQVRKVVDYLLSAKRPRFPGKIDPLKARAGEKVFINKCASCHGQYSALQEDLLAPKLVSFPNKLVTLKQIGTDSSRVDVIDEEFKTAVESSVMGEYIQVVQNKGYIAPILTSLWMSAPYLHNGSVPTLFELMNPSKRKEKFQVGGHKLNFKTVGIEHEKKNMQGVWVYTGNYKPWSNPEVYDTKSPGRSNKGHLSPFDTMSDEDKQSLLEYLKLL